MAKRRKIYEGKAKILYEGPEPGTLIQYFKDDATAFNNEKRAVLDGKPLPGNEIALGVIGAFVMLLAGFSFTAWMLHVFRRRGFVTRFS